MNTPTAAVESFLRLLEEQGLERAMERLDNVLAGSDPTAAAALRAWAGGDDDAAERLAPSDSPSGRAFAAWTSVRTAQQAILARDFPSARASLTHARVRADDDHRTLRAVIEQLTGALAYHDGAIGSATLDAYLRAYELLGDHHPLSGHLLDTVGNLYSARGNFHAAHELLLRAIEAKSEHDDHVGVAVTQGSFGRLYLSWGRLEMARVWFQRDLDQSRELGDRRGEAQSLNQLGRIHLERGELDEAARRLDECLTIAIQDGSEFLEGFGRKDRAMVHALRGEPSKAATDLHRAAELLTHKEGRAHILRVRGVLLRELGKLGNSAEKLRESADLFRRNSQPDEAARSGLELSRTLRRTGVDADAVLRVLERALDEAESARREPLVREIEFEVRSVSEIRFGRRLYSRVRGKDLESESLSLFEGTREELTAMFLDLEGYTLFARSRPEEVVLVTLNQLMADFGHVLRRHDAQVNQYLGDGFMALVRGPDHAGRAVSAALDLVAALEEFNAPRRMLSLHPFGARIGISSGDALVANVGTYDKMDWTAIGSTVNLASRIEGQAEPGRPCISARTRELVGDAWAFTADSPREFSPKGLETQRVWDVVGRA